MNRPDNGAPTGDAAASRATQAAPRANPEDAMGGSARVGMAEAWAAAAPAALGGASACDAPAALGGASACDAPAAPGGASACDAPAALGGALDTAAPLVMGGALDSAAPEAQAASAPLPLRVLCGPTDPREAAAAPALRPFDPRVTAFLADLSAALLADPRAKAYPDLTTFAFFCRRGNLRQLEAPYGEAETRLGRGMVFHIAPGNVPMNFAYSFAAALLAGNASVVKASSRRFTQVELACEAMGTLLGGTHRALAPYVCVVEYPRERQDVTEALSLLCDARVIWGGDETIRRVRQAPLPPRAFDVTFADRWSMLVCGAEAVAGLDGAALAAAAQGFYNDAYLFDQNACTAPRLLYWLGGGETLAAARARFWAAVHAYAAPRYAVDAVTAVDKRAALCRAAVELGGAALLPMEDNLIVRVEPAALTPAALEARSGGGFFLEYAADTLAPLAPLLSHKAQTVACLGVPPETVRDFVAERGLRGVDRVVPVGRTTDFSLTWDGFDLIHTLSRRIA